MKVSRAVSTMFCLALMGAAFSPNAKADAWDKKTQITFSGPVQIPAVHQPGWGVLPAGTYVFKVVESGSNRHIVQIFSKDELTVYATILAIPNLRMKATDKTVITFRERPAGQPEALRAWFYPGREWGEEFVYPKAQAIELAKSTGTPVLEMPATVTVEAAKPEEPRVIAELERTPVTAVEPSGKEVEMAQAVTPPPAAETLVAQSTPAAEPKLPKTASPLPLIALLGLLALGGGLSLRVVETRGL
jgi:hypothetical protein